VILRFWTKTPLEVRPDISGGGQNFEDPPTAFAQTTFSKSQRTGKELAVLS
jgi:hypothetical protein